MRSRPLVLADGDTAVAPQRCAERLAALTTRECFHPSCEEPAEGCDIDHVQPLAAGGATTEANGRVACGFHNRQRHRAPP